VVDRIVAHVEDDIITLSEVRELAAYQELVDGHAEPDDRILNELIEQWVVNNEATAAQFPAAGRIRGESRSGRVSRQASSRVPQAYNERLAALGLTPQAVKPRGHAGDLLWRATSTTSSARPCRSSDEDIAKYYTASSSSRL
jgi:hypothetical protein